MFNTKSLCVAVVERSDVATALTSSGLYDPRYLAANNGYLSLTERVWGELDGKSPISAGAAISDEDRDRRLWRLDRHGFYDCEQAVIGAASGRRVPVEISAQRVWCSGVACDLEFFRPLAPPRSETTPDAQRGPRAKFLPDLQANFRKLSPFDRTILMRRMLTAVAEGGLLIARVDPNPAIAGYSAELRSRLSPYVVPGRGENAVKLDFSALDEAVAERHLLELAAEIWRLIRFAKDSETAEMLQRLVAPYTVPASPVVSGEQA